MNTHLYFVATQNQNKTLVETLTRVGNQKVTPYEGGLLLWSPSDTSAIRSQVNSVMGGSGDVAIIPVDAAAFGKQANVPSNILTFVAQSQAA